jgi:cytochrome c-type biogenesis protein CcmH
VGGFAAVVLAALVLALNGPALAAPSAVLSGPDPASVVGPPAGPPLAGDALEARTDVVSHKIRCPVCQGLSAGDSPSESARAMKDEARTLVAAGYSDEQVLDYFEASYGEFIRLEPKAEGWNLLVWIAPAVFLLGGLTWVGMGVRGRAARAPLPPPAPVDPELAPWIEQVRRDVGTGA